MSPRVSLSWKTAVWLWDNVSNAERQFDITGPNVPREFKDLTAAINRGLDARKPFVTAPTRKQTKAKKDRTKGEQTKLIRSVVMARAGGLCEHCEQRTGSWPLEMDHFFGRIRVRQSERNCWALCLECHRNKTRNEPSAAFWFQEFAAHAEDHGFTEEAGQATRLLGKHEAKSALSEAAGRASHG
jgi:hypothetical protein